MMKFVIVLLVLLASNEIVRAISCGGRGYINNTDGLCSCVTNYYGPTCQYKRCPFGESWLSPPLESHVRNVPLVECSNMGTCNRNTGKCACRDGYVGRACERWGCPTGVFTSTNESGSLIVSKQTDTTVFPQVCSGHGICKSLRQMGTSFDGITLVRPPKVNYDSWDADKIQGCVCDVGWEGYDCSFKKCPWGRDPQSSISPGTQQKFNIECAADFGFFSIFAMGSYTPPIPYDADPGYLKWALEQISSIGTVRVIMEDSSDGTPIMCSRSAASPYTTTIMFADQFGPLPPIAVHSNNTGPSRMFPEGGDYLTLLGSTPVLRIVTHQELACPVCASCSGEVYFTYRDSISTAIDITSTSAASLIEAAIASLDDLANEKWPGLSISASVPQTSICSTTSTSTTSITLRTTVGPVPPLGLLDQTYYSTSNYNYDYHINLTLTNQSGTDIQYECSNQGVCDRTTGLCNCFYSSDGSDGDAYRAISSDGRGNKGKRGDCGYIKSSVSSCYDQGKKLICSGHGVCHNDTATCSCFDGWYGLLCQVKATCPMGPAWADQPISSTEAHQLAECSNMGICDRQTGHCACRIGFSGDACQYHDCDRDQITGEPCSGNGRCMSISEIYDMYGLTYGSRWNSRIYPKAWDSFSFYECVCPANNVNITTNPYPTDLLISSVGPNKMISGRPAGSQTLPGWRGWKCSERNCPTGDNIYRHRYAYTTLSEAQRAVCDNSQ